VPGLTLLKVKLPVAPEVAVPTTVLPLRSWKLTPPSAVSAAGTLPSAAKPVPLRSLYLKPSIEEGPKAPVEVWPHAEMPVVGEKTFPARVIPVAPVSVWVDRC
jgi:hypothetical protein